MYIMRDLSVFVKRMGRKKPEAMIQGGYTIDIRLIYSCSVLNIPQFSDVDSTIYINCISFSAENIYRTAKCMYQLYIQTLASGYGLLTSLLWTIKALHATLGII